MKTPGNVLLQTTETDSDGRFTFADLASGPYVLRIRARGFAEATRNIQVPSAAGGYDQEIQ